MKFHRWLLTQAHREDPVGDLARDVEQDPKWPTNDVNLHRLHGYLYLRTGTWNDANAALEEAWAEWEGRAPSPSAP